MDRTWALIAAMAAHLAVSGCTGLPAAAQLPQAETRIVASSTPAAGSTVRAPLTSLKLHFDPPARLKELKLSGPEGEMPMMIHPVGEVADYDLPLPDLQPGFYSVQWRASVGHRDYSGSFVFTVGK